MEAVWQVRIPSGIGLRLSTTLRKIVCGGTCLVLMYTVQCFMPLLDKRLPPECFAPGAQQTGTEYLYLSRCECVR